MKKTLVVVATLLVICVLVVVARRREKAPRVIESSTIDSIVNVHGSTKKKLAVCGRHFQNPQGGPPYFLPVPGTALIVFAYRGSEDKRSIVVCDTNQCIFHEIDVGRSLFGNKIGYWEASKGQWGDKIEGVSSNLIYVSSKGLDYEEKAILDLKKDTITITEASGDKDLIRID